MYPCKTLQQRMHKTATQSSKAWGQSTWVLTTELTKQSNIWHPRETYLTYPQASPRTKVSPISPFFLLSFFFSPVSSLSGQWWNYLSALLTRRKYPQIALNIQRNSAALITIILLKQQVGCKAQCWQVPQLSCGADAWRWPGFTDACEI